MSENLNLNGNGKSGINVPLVLVIFIIGQLCTGIWMFSRMSTQIEVLQQQISTIPITNEQFRKAVTDDIKIQDLKIGGLEKENILIKTKVGIR